MTDTEQVYALYVQANPVPDPEVLPLTRAEAELLTLERSTVMDTREKIEVRPTPPTPPRRRRLAFGLAAIVVVAAIAVGAFLVAGDGDSPVAAADASLEVVFDGTACRYNGPTLIEAGNGTLTLVNTSTEPIEVTGFNMQESFLDWELERTPLGTDMALTPNAVTPAGDMAFFIKAEPGSEGAGLATLLAGTHIIDCLYYEPPNDLYPNHLWRAQTTVEVVAP